jgi:hypothetical protein
VKEKAILIGEVLVNENTAAEIEIRTDGGYSPARLGYSVTIVDEVVRLQ